MSTYEKVVKLACKPKAAPPKSKYLDTIIAATWSEDGAVSDVCRALAPRFRDQNPIIVFKALIVLHSMIRNGSTDNVLSYISSTEVFRLRSVSGGAMEGYHAPPNLQNYASYLDARIRAYHHLKHDAVQVQSDSNRDMRNNGSLDRSSRANSSRNGQGNLGRSKTMMGRKLRVMTVEKGLLRETKAVHRMIDSLVDCRFYLDNLEDQLTITALRLLVKDLLILFQAGNEGVINLLENYFEMSHIDATEALSIYRNFCKQAEAVVEYLGVARKLQNLLNVSIPNLKHAPVSLAGALQEYLDDPDFERNRLEYRASKAAADRGDHAPSSKAGTKGASTPPVPPLPTVTTTSITGSSGSIPAGSSTNKDIVDFFSTIEEEQSSMFNPQTNSPNQALFQQQAAPNPFAQQQISMYTGQPSGLQPMAQQPTGFMMPQATGMPVQSNPFASQHPQLQSFGSQHLQPQPTGHRPFSSFLPPQNTGFLQPQQTGGNPFRQSALVPQTTGMALFGGPSPPLPQSGVQNGMPSNQTGFNMGSSGFGSAPGPITMQPTGTITPASFSASNSNPGFGMNGGGSSFASTSSAFSPPPRPSSTPLTNFNSTNPPIQAVKTHQTGVNNPFGRITTPPPPPVPRQPTLFELQSGGQPDKAGIGQPAGFSVAQFGGSTTSGSSLFGDNKSATNGQQKQNGAPNDFGFNSGALNAGGTDMSSIASSFAFQSKSSVVTPTSGGSSSSPGQALSSSMSFQAPTSSSFDPSLPPATSSSPLQAQQTGFATLKEFKPTSSFGTSLIGSLPTIPGTPTGVDQPSSSSIISNGAGSTFSTNTSSPNSTSGFASSGKTDFSGSFTPGQSSLGAGLRPQMTGGGAANPFRASFATGDAPSLPTNAGPWNGFNPTIAMPGTGALNSTNTGLGSSMFAGSSQPGQAPQQQSLI